MLPAWLLSIVINLILKFGVPYVLDFLHKKFPWLPISDKTKAAISDLVQDLRMHKQAKQVTLRNAKKRLKKCVGIGCPMDLVRE